MATFDLDYLAQSFQQDADNIAGASVFLLPDELSGNVEISLWDDLPTASGNKLAWGEVFGEGGDWVDVLWSPVAITAGKTYYLVFESDNGQLGIGGTESDTYLSGNIFARSGFESIDFDFAFRTFASAPGGPDLAPVPEPSTYGLLGAAALAGLIGYRRLKARAA
jgi:hypothetical protein